MKHLPENPYGLTKDHLVRVRNNLILITADKSIEAKDRVAAAKVITQLADQVWKWNYTKLPEIKEGEPESQETDADPLAGLKVVG